MGCCGGSRRGRAARQTARGVLEPEIQGPTVLMEYVGRREGSFWVKGSISGIRYRIPGSAARFKIDSRDYQYIASMPSIRKVKEQPRTTKRAEPPAEDVMLKASKESFSPTKMEEKIVKPEVPDPSKLTIPYLRSADFNVTPGVAAQMIELEKKGKNRRTAIAALKRKL